MAEIVWFEYVVSDVDRARTFYADLLGWSFERMDGYPGAYLMVDSKPVGGGILPATPQRPVGSGGCVYFRVDDIEERAARAASLGGAVVQERLDIEGVGRFVVVSDPDGNHIGLWMP